ncbi:hypothetical protein [Bittarella massiliensis (ex Durand et al. 2017)]|uniref:hypothetical protein n=1 Tax=Bittarella massiliensis (ex Durand et al. 2017) TaxID=1720313 RepID=UPI00073F6AA0|nr:hypothetical protein [Bittarella massiliensis (ex Durand et al. 2017)]
MTEWGVFGVVVALLGFLAAIVAPILKLNTNITRLTVTMEHLVEQMGGQSKKMEEIREKNHKSHERLWEKNEEQDKMLENHEGRLKVLEKMK